MHTRFLPLLCLALVLSACGTSPASFRSETLDQHLQNPLFAEQYFEDLVQRMVELVIVEDPILQNEQKKNIVDQVRREGLEKAKEATQKQLKGTMGEFLIASEWATGEALYVDNTLHFGPEFRSDSGPSLHVFLTTILDPRTESFPDKSALDLGQIQNIVGNQSYPVPRVENPLLYRTIVLFDTVLERVYAFAQLSPF